MVRAASTSTLFRALLIWRSWPWFWPLLTFGSIKRFKMDFGIAITILESTTWPCTPWTLTWRREWARRHLQCTLQLGPLFLPSMVVLCGMSFVTRWSISPFKYFAPQRGQVLFLKSLGALSTSSLFTARASTSRLRLTMTMPTMPIMMLVACVLVFSLRLLVPLLNRSQIRLIEIQIQARFISCDNFVFLTRYFWFTLFQW